MLTWSLEVPHFFSHIVSVTCENLLMGTLGLCTEMPDFSWICKIGRTNGSELALVLEEFYQSIFWISFFTYPRRALIRERGRPISIFSLLLRGCCTQEWAIQEQKGTFSVSEENCLILWRIIKYSLVNRGRGWEGKAVGSSCPIDCLMRNMQTCLGAGTGRRVIFSWNNMV